MVVTGTTHIGYMVGKGVSGVKSNTSILDCVGRGDQISKKLSREFVDETLSGLSVTNDNKFSFLRVELKLDTSHPVLDTCETLSKLSKTEIKVPMVQC